MAVTFLNLQDRAKVYILDLPTDVVSELPTLINDAIQDAMEQHNFRTMEASTSFTTTEGSHTLGQITDLKEVRDLPWLQHGDGGNAELEWAQSKSQIVREFSINDANDKGRPAVIFEADAAGNFEVYPYPDANSLWGDGDYRVHLPYWKYLTALSADGDSNWFTDNATLYVLYSAVSRAHALNFDTERAGTWALAAAQQLGEAVRVDKRSRLTRRFTLVPRRDVHASKYQTRM
jgi:hypothetical protein